MAKHHEQCRAGHRFVEHRVQAIDPALWLDPLLVEPRFQELLIRHVIRRRDRLLDIREVMAGRGRVEFDIFVEIELAIIRVSAGLIIEIAGQGGWALGIDCRRRAADETPGVADNATPPRGIQRGIVDLTDERRTPLCLIHGPPRRRTSRTGDRRHNRNRIAFNRIAWAVTPNAQGAGLASAARKGLGPARRSVRQQAIQHGSFTRCIDVLLGRTRQRICAKRHRRHRPRLRKAMPAINDSAAAKRPIGSWETAYGLFTMAACACGRMDWPSRAG